MIHFDIEALKNELKELEKQTGNQDFWLDTINSNKVLSKIKSIKGKCQKYDEIKIDIQNELELIEIAVSTDFTLLSNLVAISW